MMANPMIPAMMSFLASWTLSSFPPAVIHLKPPIKMMTTAIIPRNPRAARIIWPATSSRSPVPRPVAAPNSSGRSSSLSIRSLSVAEAICATDIAPKKAVSARTKLRLKRNSLEYVKKILREMFLGSGEDTINDRVDDRVGGKNHGESDRCPHQGVSTLLDFLSIPLRRQPKKSTPYEKDERDRSGNAERSLDKVANNDAHVRRAN